MYAKDASSPQKASMKNNYRVSRGFGKFRSSALRTFSTNVNSCMTDNPAFPNPLVPTTVLEPAVITFSNAVDAALNGGKLEIAQRNAAQEVLLGLLRQEAAYVEGVAGDDLPKLLSSGFEVVSNNRTQVPLEKPVIDRVENSGSAQLELRLQTVPTARAYEVRLSYAGGAWQAAGIFTQARKIVLTDLTPGTTYTIQARAIGGSTGSSDWSDPVSHMSL